MAETKPIFTEEYMDFWGKAFSVVAKRLFWERALNDFPEGKSKKQFAKYIKKLLKQEENRADDYLKALLKLSNGRKVKNKPGEFNVSFWICPKCGGVYKNQAEAKSCKCKQEVK